MVALDHVGRTDDRHALDDVRVQGALREEIKRAECLRFALEHVDERRADRLALGFRIGDAREALEEERRRVDEDERQAQPRPCPTCSRMRAVASSTNDDIVQSPRHPHTPYTKLRRISVP